MARVAVPTAALVAVLARLPFVARPAAPDEAGYLLVGQQWRSGGTSLYGNYWVDRPPLLITLFRVAADLGGLVPLRLLGCLATAVVVLGCGRMARTIAGPAAAGWSAAVAAALCVNPLLGGLEVNGELLAAPFVVVGMSAALRATRKPGRMGAVVSWSVAGGATVAALLIKQNMADIAVFSVVTLLMSRHRNGGTASRAWPSVGGFLAGGVAVLVVAAGWTLSHGTSLSGVFDAVYPFRWEAARVMAASSHRHATTRMWALCISWLVSGGALIMGMMAWALCSRRLNGPVTWALSVTMAFDVVSIALGGSYWHHYLVELIVPVAVASGVLAGRRQPGSRAVLVVTLVAGLVAWTGALWGSTWSDASAIGRAVGRSARTGDTIISAFGNAEITRASGLRSPYPYLWSLPARTLDARQTDLDGVLAGPHAATWFVTSSSLAYFGSVNETTARLLSTRYHRVAELYGRTIYLHDGVVRRSPRLRLADDLAVTGDTSGSHVEERP